MALAAAMLRCGFTADERGEQWQVSSPFKNFLVWQRE
jgi:hypothetical protein